MYKLLLFLLLSLALHAKLIDGVAIIVKNEPITMLDITNTMQQNGIDRAKAIKLLMREKLEQIEIKQRDITVTNQEVIEEIKRIAALNHITVEQFYSSLQNQEGLTLKEIQEKMKKRIESQKLFQAIAFSHMYQPSQQEIEDYFELHKKEFEHPQTYSVSIYGSKDGALLQRKVNNPMFYSAQISSEDKVLQYDQIPPRLAKLLDATKVNRFSKIVPNGSGGYMTFYIKSVGDITHVTLKSVEPQIKNQLMAAKRQQVLSEYFNRLKANADIRTIRLPKDNG
jgi:peptidyl-prolyl cis-trans isomerase SurA